MAKQVQLRRGTTAQHSTFTGAVGEVTIDTDKDVVVVHDGATAGGFPLAKDSAKVDKVTSTDNAIVRFNGTSGAVQNSGVTIDDTNKVSANSFEASGNVTVNGALSIAKTNWLNANGIPYADDGLQGVPDTSFSPTGARIYPDGTIRGKSSYGEYVKYPDGRLECIAKNLTFPYESYGYVWYFPCLFIGTRICMCNADAAVGDARNTVVGTLAYNDLPTNVSYASLSFWTRSQSYSAVIDATSYVGNAIAIGTWK